LPCHLAKALGLHFDAMVESGQMENRKTAPQVRGLAPVLDMRFDPDISRQLIIAGAAIRVLERK
jgi:hypothetical protein